MRNSISFYLNGVKKNISAEQMFQPLSSYLRYEKQLTGTKVVCAEGDCGACSVLVAKWTPQGYGPYVAVNSCIAMTFSLDGANLITVEGLSDNNNLSEVQDSMVRNFGGQCGFCTPGFVVTITGMYELNKNPTEQNVKNYLTGNLCRCTGYAPIIKSALDVNLQKHTCMSKKYPIQSLAHDMGDSVYIKTENIEYFAPTSMQEACKYKSANSDCTIFSGATDLGVLFNKGHIRPRKILNLQLIPDLYSKEISSNKVLVGARVTLTELQQLIAKSIPQLNSYLHIFASPQIKNSATLVGNLANASPIADTTPVMMALDAELEIWGTQGKRQQALSEFYLGYKKVNLKLDEIISAVSFNIPSKNNKFANYKVSQRRDLDISTVNASFNFEIINEMVSTARIALGGVAATTIRMTEIEKSLVGKKFDLKLIQETKESLISSINPMSDLRGSREFRKILIGNLFEKFIQEEIRL